MTGNIQCLLWRNRQCLKVRNQSYSIHCHQHWFVYWQNAVSLFTATGLTSILYVIMLACSCSALKYFIPTKGAQQKRFGSHCTNVSDLKHTLKTVPHQNIYTFVHYLLKYYILSRNHCFHFYMRVIRCRSSLLLDIAMSYGPSRNSCHIIRHSWGPK